MIGDPAPVVLGIGNTLLSDDGFGVHVVRGLADDPALPPGVTIVDGGTGGLSLLPAITGAPALAIVDAVDRQVPPGQLSVLTGADLSAAPARLSIHEIGLAELLGAARLTGVLPERTVLIGVQPATLTPGLALSPEVAAAVPAAVAAILSWCRALEER